jgi:protein O-GlcNAc transferase
MNNSTDLLRRALQHYQARMLDKAEELYRQVLAIDPDSIDANYRLGLIAHQSGRLEESEAFLLDAIGVMPTQPALHYTLGLVRHDLKRLDDAAASFRRAIGLNPTLAEAYNNLGLVLQDKGTLEAAAAELERALAIRPNYASALNNLAGVRHALGQLQQAEACLRQVLELQPNFPQGHFNLGQVLARQDRHPEALEHLRKAIRMAPDHADGYFHWARSAYAQRDLVGAIASYRAGLQRDPENYEITLEFADLLAKVNATDEARSYYERACQLRPEQLRPLLGASLTLPVIYRNAQEVAETRERYAQGLLRLCSEKPHVSEQDIEVWISDLQWTNFFLAYQGHDDRELQSAYGKFLVDLVRGLAPDLSAPVLPNPTNGRRIKVAYVSRFFRECTAGMYFRSWITDVDHSRFEIATYYLDTLEDNLSREIRVASDTYYLYDRNLLAIARAIKHDCPDILVFPEVGMDVRTFVLAAMRLAPIQCAAWGHPVTTGLPTIDYFLSCFTMEPKQASSQYTEQLCLLDGIGTCYPTPKLPAPKGRRDLGLPEGKTLYLFPQSLFKIHPDNDLPLSRILAADENAVLVGFQNQFAPITDAFVQRLGRAFAQCGVDASKQLVMLPYLSHDDYLCVNMACDLMIDSFYWSGGHTSLDALACGLPIVTLPGSLMRGRQTAGMLQLMSLPDLIAADIDDYIAIALRVGADAEWRAALRARILNQVSAIFDQKRPIQTLEELFSDFVSKLPFFHDAELSQ